MNENMIEFIEKDIDECTQIIEKRDIDAAKIKLKHIDAAYSEVPGIHKITRPPIAIFVSTPQPVNSILDRDPYTGAKRHQKPPQIRKDTSIEDLVQCVGLLNKYIATLQDESKREQERIDAETRISQINQTFNMKQSNNNEAIATSTSTSAVKIEQVIENINNLSNDELNENEKAALIDLLKKIPEEAEDEYIVDKIINYARKGEDIGRTIYPYVKKWAPKIAAALLSV